MLTGTLCFCCVVLWVRAKTDDYLVLFIFKFSSDLELFICFFSYFFLNENKEKFNFLSEINNTYFLWLAQCY